MDISKRPKVDIPTTGLDLGLELIGISILLYHAFDAISAWEKLPDIIPTHFNVSGQVNGYGSKNTLFILLIFSIVIFIFLSILAKFPHTYKYNIEITPKNAKIHYKNGVRLIRFLKLDIVIIFTYLETLIINATFTKTFHPGNLLLYIFFIIIASIAGFFITKSID